LVSFGLCGEYASKQPLDKVVDEMTVNDFRRLALAMAQAIEGSHMAHPDFRVNGRIFATIYPDNLRGMVQLTPDAQQAFIRAHPDVFEPASGAWGRGGSTTVRLEAADHETVGEAMTLAWQNAIRKPAPRKTRPAQGRRRRKQG
jgi:hypothetical protein